MKRSPKFFLKLTPSIISPQKIASLATPVSTRAIPRPNANSDRSSWQSTTRFFGALAVNFGKSAKIQLHKITLLRNWNAKMKNGWQKIQSFSRNRENCQGPRKIEKFEKSKREKTAEKTAVRVGLDFLPGKPRLIRTFFENRIVWVENKITEQCSEVRDRLDEWELRQIFSKQ